MSALVELKLSKKVTERSLNFFKYVSKSVSLSMEYMILFGFFGLMIFMIDLTTNRSQRNTKY